MKIRSLYSAVYFVFMFLSLVTQTRFISSFRSVPHVWQRSDPYSGGRLLPPWTLAAGALLKLAAASPGWCRREGKGLQEHPNVTLLFGKGCCEWSLGTVIGVAGGFCSNRSSEHGH